MKLYKIGELARLSDVGRRTIDYYTKIGLIQPETRSEMSYRLYSDKTLTRLKRIESMKSEKYTLEEIKANLNQWNKVSNDEIVQEKLISIQLLLNQIDKEINEIGPLIQELKPAQLKKLNEFLTKPALACIETILLLQPDNSHSPVTFNIDN